MIKYCYLLLSISLMTLSTATHADPKCFAQAINLYQTLFCEIKADGQGKSLPKLFDFKQNEPAIQALLIKPHAKKRGINIKIPRTQVATVQDKSENQALTDSRDCQISGPRINCSNTHYAFINNRARQHISADALSPNNRLILKTPPLVEKDSTFLARSYEHYLKAMHTIGLAGLTMNYAKFAYLYQDLRRQNISFSDRFETMYEYLKRDRKTMGSPNMIRLPDQLSIKHCSIMKSFIACPKGHINYVFAAISPH